MERAGKVLHRNFGFQSRLFGMLLIFICLSFKLKGQDVHFSQYYANPAFLNPGLIGVEKDIYFGLSYRSQWRNLESPFNTYQFSIIHPLFSEGSENIQVGGLGLTVFQDESGSNAQFKTSGFLLTGSYNLRLDTRGKNVIGFGLQAGLTRKSIDLGSLQWGSQYNPLIGYDRTIIPDIVNVEERVIYPVINTGAVYYFNPGKQYYFNPWSGFLGFSVAYINRPNESFIDASTEIVPMLLKLHGGFETRIAKKWYLSPNALYMYQGIADELNVGAYFTYKALLMPNRRNLQLQSLTVGAWHRLGDAFIFNLGLATPSLSFGFSYDINAHQLNQQFQGLSTFELSLTYRVITGKGIKRFSTPLM